MTVYWISTAQHSANELWQVTNGALKSRPAPPLPCLLPSISANGTMSAYDAKESWKCWRLHSLGACIKPVRRKGKKQKQREKTLIKLISIASKWWKPVWLMVCGLKDECWPSQFDHYNSKHGRIVFVTSLNLKSGTLFFIHLLAFNCGVFLSLIFSAVFTT